MLCVSVATDQKEEKELAGSLAEKKLPSEGCTGRNGERENSSGQKKNMGGVLVGVRIKCIRFADDLVLLTEEEMILRDILLELNDNCEQYGMKINANKTKTMVIGRKITKGKELRKRLVKCFVWSAALYGAEIWTLRRSEEKRLEAFEMWMWRRMESVKWTDRIRNEAVLERVETALRNKDYSVYDEVHGISSEGSNRRIDIIAFKPPSLEGYIIDPTVRFESHEHQPEEVHEEKRNIYEPSISFYKDKYHLESIVITGLMIGARGTIPRFLVDFCKSFGLHKDILRDLTIAALKGSITIFRQSTWLASCWPSMPKAAGSIPGQVDKLISVDLLACKRTTAGQNSGTFGAADITSAVASVAK
ncbi:hypothetical protein ANN_25249 [Periplaneta americana]|uniref:Reverse transcriptase domain-containing protein n=1 Tax=Periplaneta americana TaxID=6978 RepID=A0ABQ8S0S5_PERAM|nr:hypothetical protein ANN_25249 [Periplaneta americana]